MRALRAEAGSIDDRGCPVIACHLNEALDAVSCVTRGGVKATRWTGVFPEMSEPSPAL